MRARGVRQDVLPGVQPMVEAKESWEEVDGPVRQEQGPVAAFQRNWRSWESLPGVAKRVVAWVRDGYKVQWAKWPRVHQRNKETGREWNAAEPGEQTEWMRQEVAIWCQKGVAREVAADEDAAGAVYHPLKVADKPGWEKLAPEKQWRKKYRLCLAVAKEVNEAVVVPPLKMETLERAVGLAQKDDWMVVGDLEAGYNHIALHEESKRWFRFRLDGKRYEMVVLFFIN